MESRRIAGVAPRIAIQLKEVGKLQNRAAAGAGAGSVPGAVTSASAGSIGIDRIIAVAMWFRRVLNDFAHLGQNGCRVAAAGAGAGVDDMARVRCGRADCPVGPGIFVDSFCVVGVRKTGVPGVHAGDLVAAVAAPGSTPEDTLNDGGGHDVAIVVKHVRRPGTGIAGAGGIVGAGGAWVGALRPVNPRILGHPRIFGAPIVSLAESKQGQEQRAR